MDRETNIGLIIGAVGAAIAGSVAVLAGRARDAKAPAGHAGHDASLSALEIAQRPTAAASGTSQKAPEPIEIVRPAAVYPLPLLPDGRKPRITSHHKARNPSRKAHNGADWFYPVMPGDPDWQRGDGGGTRNGRWIVPPDTPAIAVDRGRVQIAGNTRTGWRVWVEHGPLRTGYFHLTKLFVKQGEQVTAGQQLGIIGDNPGDYDARHLHFELSPTECYDPVDPVPYLARAAYLPLSRTMGPIRHIAGISTNA